MVTRACTYPVTRSVPEEPGAGRGARLPAMQATEGQCKRKDVYVRSGRNTL